MTSTPHTDCTHEATSSARAKCRKARAAGPSAQVIDLLAIFASKAIYDDEPLQWVFYAARRFASYKGTDRFEAAALVLTHFLPSGDDAADARRKANGYILTTDIRQMLSITLRAAS